MPLLKNAVSWLLGEEKAGGSIEQRSSLENPQTPLSYPAEWLLDLFNGGRTDSGIRVSEMTAFQVSTFLACCDLIAAAVSSMPVHVYEQTVLKSGRAVRRAAYEHELYDLIHYEPNEEMSRMVAFKAYMLHCLAWGNGYQEVQRDAGNGVVAFWPRNPYKTAPYRVRQRTRLNPEPWRPFPSVLEAGTLCYRTTDGIEQGDDSDVGASVGGGRLIVAQDMLAIPGISFDGRIGQSVVQLARQTLGLALATEKYGAKYFSNFARPGGILEMPANVSEPQKLAARNTWQESQGGENAHRTAVLSPGWKFIPVSNNPEEAQAVETKQDLRQQICAMLHVPPHMVGEIDKGRSNTEQLAQEFVTYALHPWLTAIKLEWCRKLFPGKQGRGVDRRYLIDFDRSDMLRPDAASREKYYSTGRQWGFLCANDVRGMENLNPIDHPSGEDFWMPVNMTLAETPLNPNSQDGAGKGVKPADTASARLFARVWDDAAGRVNARDRRDAVAFDRAFRPVLASIVDQWRDVARRDMDIAEIPQVETDEMVRQYLAGLQQRWSDAIDVQDEYSRANRSIRVAVYREAAAAKAKEPAIVH